MYSAFLLRRKGSQGGRRVLPGCESVRIPGHAYSPNNPAPGVSWPSTCTMRVPALRAHEHTLIVQTLAKPLAGLTPPGDPSSDTPAANNAKEKEQLSTGQSSADLSAAWGTLLAQRTHLISMLPSHCQPGTCMESLLLCAQPGQSPATDMASALHLPLQKPAGLVQLQAGNGQLRLNIGANYLAPSWSRSEHCTCGHQDLWNITPCSCITMSSGVCTTEKQWPVGVQTAPEGHRAARAS